MVDILEQGRMINGVYYAGQLRRLYQEIARKRRGKSYFTKVTLKHYMPIYQAGMSFIVRIIPVRMIGSMSFGCSVILVFTAGMLFTSVAYCF